METGYVTGACEGDADCTFEHEIALCYQTFDYPADLNTDHNLGAGKCSVCGDYWPLEA